MFWKSHPNPSTTGEFVSWIAQQCTGIASGLNAIHNYAVGDPESSGSGKRLTHFGRHGDLKPENILRFIDGHSSSGLGTLKISDMGLTRFHSTETRTWTDARQVAVSPTYRAPECDIGGSAITRSYDIWTLGCLYLEFISWLLLGYETGIDQFSRERARDDEGVIQEDKFFKLVDTGDGTYAATIKSSVAKVWILLFRVRIRLLTL